MTTELEKSPHRDLFAWRSLERMIAVWRRLALERQGASVTQDGNLVNCWALSPLIFMNIVFVANGSGKSAPLVDTLEKASTLLRAKPEPGLVLLIEEQLGVLDKEALEDTAKTVGLRPKQGLWGMECLASSQVSRAMLLQTELGITRAGFDDEQSRHMALLAG